MKSFLAFAALTLLVACGGSSNGGDKVSGISAQRVEVKTNYSSTSSTIKLSSLLSESVVDCGLEVGPGEEYDFKVSGGKITLTDDRNTTIVFKEKAGATTLLYDLESSTDPRVKAAELEMPDSRTIRLMMECR